MPTTSDRGLFVWHELNTTDLTSADGFYSNLIGWKSRPWDPNPNYRIWGVGRDGRAGLYQMHEQPNTVTPPPHWLVYIGTPDVDSTVRQAVELGGKVATPAYDVRGVGRMAVLQDPQGALFAVSQQIERTRYRDPQPGDFSWHELVTSNWQTAFEFYSKLFGWEKMQAMDMGPQGTYQIYGTGGHQLGGMFTPAPLPGGAPQWVPYILVRDARRAADRARELGATIAQGPMEVPGGDWIFVGVDRQGAMFATHSKKRAAATAKARTTKAPAATARRNTAAAKARTTKARKKTAATKARRTRTTTKARRGATRTATARRAATSSTARKRR